MFKNKGDRLESLVQYVYQTLSDNTNSKIIVERQKKIMGKSGVDHIIDVYYEFSFNNVTHKVIIECKNWNKKVSKEKILTLSSIVDDIPHSVGIIIAPKGFQSGAKEFAKHQEIILISESDNSLFTKAILSKFNTILPDENIMGEPFWCLMDSKTGNYISYDGGVHLFISKKIATDFASEIGGDVRGISQNHLKMICFYNKEWNMDLYLHLFELKEAVKIDYKLLEELFLISSN